MNIGIIGGTGGMGKGFAFRWCKNHNVIIGSRDADRAATTATEYTTQVCLLYTSPSPRDATLSRMPSSA